MPDFCPGCMKPLLPDEQICRECGFDVKRYIPKPHHLLPGTMLCGRYRIGAVLGEGGFGITYVGFDSRLRLKIAVKEFYMTGCVGRVTTYSPSVQISAGSAEVLFERMKRRFLEEAQVLAQFSEEPGIVSVRDFFEENGTAYIIMAFLSGESLRKRLEREKKLNWEQTYAIMQPVLESLSIVHEHGIIHRDISPDNIMLTDRGQVCLIDFGAARAFSHEASQSLSVILKPGYAPEEQYRTRGKQGPWTDVYALCATMYRCITGIVPDEAMERLVEDLLQSPSALCNCPEHVNCALMKGLAVRAQDRFQSVGALREALSAPMEREQSVGTVAEVIEDSVPRQPASSSESEAAAPVQEAASSIVPAQRQPVPEYHPMTQVPKPEQQAPTHDALKNQPVPEVHPQTQRPEPMRRKEEEPQWLQQTDNPWVRDARRKIRNQILQEVAEGQLRAEKAEQEWRRKQKAELANRKETENQTTDQNGRRERLKKRLLIGGVVLLILLIGFFTIHIWKGESCTDECILCGKLRRDGGHLRKSATCTEPSICYICGDVYGTAAGHDVRVNFEAEGYPLVCTDCFWTEKSPAADAASSGACGENAAWALSADGVLTIFGKGRMQDYEEEASTGGYRAAPQPWYDLRSEINKAVISEDITHIGSSAFYDCENLLEISIPNSVTSMGHSVFRDCSSLPEVELPPSITSVQSILFYGCSNLTKVILPDGATIIGKSQFYNCSCLVEIEIPDSVTAILDHAFRCCSSLTEIVIPDKVSSVGECAFEGCSELNKVVIPETVTSIGVNAFQNCSGDLTIYGVPGSAAETYAEENNIRFALIEG